MSEEEIQEMLVEAHRKIDRILVHKLRLIGIYPEDLKEPGNVKKLQLLKTQSYKDSSLIIEEYSAMGILLFEVWWERGGMKMVEPVIDEFNPYPNTEEDDDDE